ncbi:hypothetical protein EVAR_34356_1 [Eumeta japonica]|uniref:Uncharacterized protein n=1 Tax=Eumeta variegata TaxID=151549 RepID=A0A4C1ZZM0_EUMVA|nr:hypothetical protein EVAR_34356_1 [Eumeta japonica]
MNGKRVLENVASVNLRSSVQSSTVDYAVISLGSGSFAAGQVYVALVAQGRPSTAITEENVTTVRQSIEENRRVTYKDMRGHLGIGGGELTKLRQARSVGKKVIAFLVYKADPVCTIPLEEQKINAE